ncbi:MAG: hypothetical protein KBS95_07915 [Alistipes sp.]|nr:hypothetical protein [Candidatus Alistipes equi]
MATELMFAHALLRVEWLDTPNGYRCSWLSRVFPVIDVERSLENNEASIIKRMTKKIRSKFREDDGNRVIDQALNVYAVHINVQLGSFTSRHHIYSSNSCINYNF